MPAKHDLTRWVHVRLSEEEKKLLEDRAWYFDTSESEFVRSLISLPIEIQDDAFDHQRENEDDGGNRRLILVYDRKSYPQLIKQLKHWGYHYDNCLHALNIIASKRFLTPEETSSYIAEALSYLDRIDAAQKELTMRVDAMMANDHVRLDVRKKR